MTLKGTPGLSSVSLAVGVLEIIFLATKTAVSRVNWWANRVKHHFVLTTRSGFQSWRIVVENVEESRDAPHTCRVMPWNTYLWQPAPKVIPTWQQQVLFRLWDVHRHRHFRTVANSTQDFHLIFVKQYFGIFLVSHNLNVMADLLSSKRTHSHWRLQRSSALSVPVATETAFVVLTLRCSCWQPPIPFNLLSLGRRMSARSPTYRWPRWRVCIVLLTMTEVMSGTGMFEVHRWLGCLGLFPHFAQLWKGVTLAQFPWCQSMDASTPPPSDTSVGKLLCLLFQSSSSCPTSLPSQVPCPYIKQAELSHIYTYEQVQEDPQYVKLRHNDRMCQRQSFASTENLISC